MFAVFFSKFWKYNLVLMKTAQQGLSYCFHFLFSCDNLESLHKNPRKLSSSLSLCAYEYWFPTLDTLQYS